jgi:hypothetical protein
MLSEIPLWGWVAAAALVWYPLAGLALRRLAEKTGGYDGDEAVHLWLISPAVIPAVVCVAAVVLVACAASVVLWPLSCGLVQPFWRWQV